MNIQMVFLATIAVTVLTGGLIRVSAVDFSDNTSQAAIVGTKVDHKVATANSPVFVMPVSQSQVSDPTQSLIEITIEPTIVDKSEAYLVNVHAVGLHRSEDALPRRLFVGSFSFFPPPVEGQTRKFLIGVPKFSARIKPPYELMIELVPANSNIKLRHSAVKVLGVKIIN